MGELFGLKISEGAVANIFQRFTGSMAAARVEIVAEIRTADVVASDETTTRIDGRIC
jgi:transposase